MAMRITTKMMQNRSLNNLNTNKTLQEKLTTQLSTMKKITRPSDDPVIAIRSLKLNSTLNKIDQYYEKNSNDAQSWLELTESAIKTTNSILEDMSGYITQWVHLPQKKEQPFCRIWQTISLRSILQVMLQVQEETSSQAIVQILL